MASLSDRVSLVTGAAKGIGLAISKALLDHGGKVHVIILKWIIYTLY